MKTSTKLLSMFSAFCAIFLLGMSANAQSVTVIPGMTATQMAQTLVGANVTVTNATYTGAGSASGSFNQASSTFPLTDGIILTSGSAINALGPNNSTGVSTANNTAGDADLTVLAGGITTFDAAVLEFDITSNCNTVTFDYIFASEEYPEYGCSNFNDAFGFLISGPGFTPNTNIALVPGTTTPVSINNVINSPGTNCVSNPSYYVDNSAGVSVQYDGYTVVMTATATIQPCQTYHVKIVVGDAGDGVLDSAIFLKGGGINCTSPSLATTASITALSCGTLGEIDLSVNSGTGPFTYSWVGPNNFTATTEDLTGLAAGDYTVDITGSDCLSSGQATFTVTGTVDVTAPVFTNCPSDLIIDAANNSCGFSVDVLANVAATDDCGVTSLVSSHDASYVFGVGTTPVTITATDAAGNSSTCTFNVIVNAQQLVVTLTPFVYNAGVNIKCFGQNSGRVTAGAAGGCAPYTFTWSSGFVIPGPPSSTSTCVALFAGVVSCTVTDAAGTSVTEVVTLVENPPVEVVPTWTPIQCYGGTSTVTINAQAGSAPYNGLTVNDLFTGTYEYVVSDANGCRAFDTITITQPDILDATATPDPILCWGDSTLVDIVATGGTAPYGGTGQVWRFASPTQYSFDIIDANGCTENVQLAINEPAQLTAMISNTPILCNGDSSLVTVSVASGTEPYTGTGTIWKKAGWHSFVVYDFNLCTDTIGILVTEPSVMSTTITATPISCAGGTTDITITGAGGTGAWNGPGTYTQNAGTFGYTMTDANGCTDSISITVSEPSQLTIDVSTTGIACFGDLATVVVTAAGGVAPYSGVGSFTAGNGTTVFTVTDANGCTISDSITLVEPALMTAFASCPAPPACFGDSATIAVTAFGGTLPYTNDGVYLAGEGSTTYVITDANGCTASVTHTVTAPSPLVISITSTGIDCNGGTADITVSGSGGTAPYIGEGTYSVSEGTYTYTLTDANGCTTDTTITVTEPTLLVASSSAPSILCNGDAVDVTVTATGGTAPYTGTGSFSQTAGMYTYTITDANGCTATTSITLTEPSAMTAFVSCPGILCNGGTADIALTAFGGTPAYTGTGVFTVSAGTDTYTVTDANGCTASVTHTVTEPAALVATISATSIDCNGGTADVTVTAAGGTPSYTGTGTFTGLSAGTYTYTVTDANGCTTTETITVAEPAVLVASSSAPAILCNGGSTDVAVTATGGTAPYTGTGSFSETAGTYTYTITDANGCTATTSITLTEPTLMTAYASCPVIDCNGGTADMAVFAFGGTPPYTGSGVYSVTAGTYTYTITDANGCTATVTHTVTEPAAIVVSITSTGIDCNGGSANVTVSATGGTGPLSGTGTFSVTSGTYSYTVTDANGCTATETITVSEPTPLMASSTAGTILCNGGSADVTVTATGGTAPYSGTATMSQSAGTVTYTVTDANGCTATTTVTLTEPTLMTAFASCPTILCNGGTTDIAVTAFGGTPPYTGGGLFSVTAGTYTYTLTDANGCTASVTHTVTEPAAIVVSIASTGIDCNGGTADLTVTATGGTAPLTGTGVFNVTFGTYTYTVTDANGCTGTATTTVAEPSAIVVAATCPAAILCNGGSTDVIVTATGGLAPYSGTGTYSQAAGTVTYTVTDANGCTSSTTVTLGEPAALSATATVGTYDCATSTAPVTITATGGTAPYTSTGVIDQGVGTTTYTVVDANGCSVTVTATVELQDFVSLACPGDQTYACNYSQSCGSQSTGSLVTWDEPTASSFNTCDNGCGPTTAIAGFIYMGEYNGSRYYCSNGSNYSWQTANTLATNAGGHLASIQSAGENNFVSSQIMANVAWIGYNDQAVEGTFEWTSGEAAGFENWAGYEPNNNGPVPNNCTYCGEADYAVISGSHGGWYDRYECNLHEFVMEIPCGNPITITQTSGPANGSFVTGGTSQVVTYVATDDVTGATATCSFTVNVEKCTPVYCESEGYCTSYEWIDQVSLGSINNQSGNDYGYADYTTMATGASVGDVINLTLTPGFSGSSYVEAWRVWIDWNYDGDFYDTGEMVYQGYGSSAVSGSFTVPAYATVNEDLRVRVSMRWGCYPGPCSTYQYGEVEDYTIFILGGGIDGLATVIGEAGKGSETNTVSVDNVKTYEDVVEDTPVGGIGLELGNIYPNPVLATNGKFNLDVRIGNKSDVTVSIIDLSGKVLLTDVMHLETGANKRTMDVTGFARGSYLIQVVSGDLKSTTQLIVQ